MSWLSCRCTVAAAPAAEDDPAFGWALRGAKDWR